MLKLTFDHNSQSGTKAVKEDNYYDDDDDDDDDEDDDDECDNDIIDQHNVTDVIDKRKKSVDKNDRKITKKEETFPIYQDFMPETEEADLESKVDKLIAKALAKRSVAASSEGTSSAEKKKTKKRKRSPTPSSRSSSASSASSADNQEEEEAEESDNDLKMAKRSSKGKSARKSTTHKAGKKSGKKSGVSSSQKKQLSAVNKSLTGIQKKLHKIFNK